MRNKPSIDLTGKRFGRWTVIEYVGGSKWLCKCDCGTIRDVSTQHLKNGKTVSCGCYQRESTTIRNTTHGMNKTPLHYRWLDIKNRCYNPNRAAYSNYGGRGIKMCEEWKNNFQAFYDWAIQNGYEQSLTIDRIDNNGDYSPENCRWVDRVTQNCNRRNNRYLTIDGKTKALSVWARESGINESVIRSRLKNGWSEADAVFKPPRKMQRVEIVV